MEDLAADAIARSRAGTGADAFDGAGDLVAEDDGEFGVGAVGAVALDDVVVGDADGADLEQDFLGAGLGDRHVLEAEGFGRPVGAEDCGFHGAAVQNAPVSASQVVGVRPLAPSSRRPALRIFSVSVRGNWVRISR